MVSPGAHVRAQSEAAPSCSANSMSKRPCSGRGLITVNARWWSFPSEVNHSRSHRVGNGVCRARKPSSRTVMRV